MTPGHRAQTLSELARFFLWIGAVGFGGPVVHVALLEEHVVRRRRWLDSREFLDLLGLTNLIPGPNSTEMAMAIGYRRAGLSGLFVAGICFILPAACLTLILAWLYVQYSALPGLVRALAGLGPAVVVVMAQGTWRLGREAVRTTPDAMVAALVLVLALAGVGELPLLLGAAAVGALGPHRTSSATVALLLALAAPLAASTIGGPTLEQIGGFFLRVGAVLYGGGYVLVAFLQGLVDEQGWLTQRQLIDAVAAGQVTPGPVLTTATFAGYLLRGWSGALVATAAVFFPAFVFTALLGPITPWLRRTPRVGDAVHLVSVAAVAIVAAVTVTLALRVLTTPASAAPAVAAALVAWRRGGTVWVLAAGIVVSVLVLR
jgi:chromate transporter